MTKLVGVDDGVDRLDHPAGHVEFHDGDHPPSARRAGGSAAPRGCAPAAMRCRARAKIWRQFTSVLPVTLATSG